MWGNKELQRGKAAVRERSKDNGGQQVDCCQVDLSRPLKLREICRFLAAVHEGAFLYRCK